MRRLGRLLRRLRRDQRGAGAVEFALIAPLLVVILLGGTEIGIGLSVYRKVENVAGTVGDIATQMDVPTSQQFESLVKLGPTLMEPYPSDGLVVSLTSVWIDDKKKAVVECSWATDPSAKKKKGDPFVLPASLAGTANRSILVTTSSYAYAPASTLFVDAKVPMEGAVYLVPRNGSRMTWTGC